MKIHRILSLERACLGHSIHSKKKILELIAKIFAQQSPSLNAPEIFDALVLRERLGSTGVGHGVALPHCRLPGLEKVLGALIYLNEGVQFDAEDGVPVDLFFALLVPENIEQEHLHILASLAEKFGQATFRDKLRQSKNAQELYLSAIDE